MFRGLQGLLRYFADLQAYSRLPGAESWSLVDTYPCVHDRQSHTSIDSHYFFVNGWAMRRVLANRPEKHVDIASQTIFVNLLSAVLPVIFLDYRPLPVAIAGLYCLGGDLLKLPFADASISSLSCLHVAEHIGLGRYGDPLDPGGTPKAARELARILAPGGNLYFAVPVGKPRLCFNAHRIFAPETIREYFDCLELVEFSGVHDDGRFVEKVTLSEFNESRYACGFFWFRR
jgi:SAM-dependent methyltransferase